MATADPNRGADPTLEERYTFRAPGELLDRVEAEADANNQSAAIREALRAYVDD